MSILKDYMESHNINNVIFMLTESFEVTIGRKLSNDEVEYLAKTIKNVFNTYSVTYDKTEVLFAGEKEKAKVDKIIKKFMVNLTKLMTHYVFSRLEAYILYQELKKLRSQDPQ